MMALLGLPLLALADDTLVLYTSQPNTDAQQTVDAFQAAYPEIEVEWVRDGTTQLMARLQAELSSGVVRPDVLLIADSVTMESLKRDDHLAAYESEEREAFDEGMYDPEGYYYGTKRITTGIVYNTRAAEQPERWQDLTQPAYEGQVTMPSPLYSGAALIHLATLTDAPELGWDYYEALAENGVTAQGGNGGVLNDVASGNKAYGVIVDFLPIREAAKGAPVKFVFPEEGVSAVTEPVAIMKEAAHPEAARKFVDFVLSREGQELVLSQGYLPGRNDVDSPEGFPPREEIHVLPLDAQSALEQAEAHKQRFAELFGG
nr:ABC transporter substrate-binding protein [Halomonas xinjiangensis]